MADLRAKSPMDKRIVDLILPTVEGMGYRLVRLRLTSAETPVLQVMAERPDGAMEVEDCAELSRALSAILDVEDPIHGEYTLEVSSPGIDRPLTTLEDFERWSGWTAKIELEQPIDGRRRFKGELRGAEAGEALIEIDAGVVGLSFDLIADAKLVMTDALIAESLKGRKTPSADPALYDEVIEDADEQSGSREEA